MLRLCVNCFLFDKNPIKLLKNLNNNIEIIGSDINQQNGASSWM